MSSSHNFWLSMAGSPWLSYGWSIPAVIRGVLLSWLHNTLYWQPCQQLFSFYFNTCCNVLNSEHYLQLTQFPVDTHFQPVLPCRQGLPVRYTLIPRVRAKARSRIMSGWSAIHWVDVGCCVDVEGTQPEHWPLLTRRGASLPHLEQCSIGSYQSLPDFMADWRGLSVWQK